MIITNAVLTGLRTQLSAQFQAGYQAMHEKTFYQDVATVIPSSTASNTYDWLGDFPDLIEWIGDRQIKDMKEFSYQINNKLFESTVGVKRTNIEDDNLGMYAGIAFARGEAAARHRDQLMAALMKDGENQLCYDGQNFFDTDHPVYATHDQTGAAGVYSNYDDGGGAPGPAWFLLDTSKFIKPFILQERSKPEFDTLDDPSKTDTVFMKDQYLYGVRARHNAGYGFPQMAFKSKAALNAGNFEAAFEAGMEIKADGDRPAGIMYDTMYVAPKNLSKAKALLKAATANGGDSNINYEAVELKVTPWMAGA